MARTRKSEPDESLDLLLDTITNTFGGLIFIAILIALLVGDRQPDASQTKRESDADELKAMEIEIAQITTEIELLEQQAESEKEFLNTFTTDRQRSLATRLSSLNAKLNTTKSENRQLKNQTQQYAGKVEKLADDLDKLNQKLADIKTESETVGRELAEEKSKRTTDINAPKQVFSKKRVVSVVIRWNRVYFLSDKTGYLIFSTSPDFERVSESKADIVDSTGNFRTKKTRGIPLTDQAALVREFGKIDKNRFNVTVAIWEESFGQFKHLNQVLLSKQLKMRPILLPDGAPISFTATGTKKFQ